MNWETMHGIIIANGKLLNSSIIVYGKKGAEHGLQCIQNEKTTDLLRDADRQRVIMISLLWIIIRANFVHIKHNLW